VYKRQVFIGASAAGVEGLKNTSISPKTPGVFLHASAYGNIMTGDFLTFTGHAINFLLAFVLLTITVFSIFYFKGILSQVLSPLLAIIVFFAFALLVFNSNLVVNITTPSFATLSAYLVSFTYISFTEGKEKRRIKNVLEQYVSPAMISTVLKHNPDDYLKAEVGTKEILTIFFSDIRDFTTITEKYNIEKIVEVLNAYLSRMADIIFNNEGTLDKFVGDAIVLEGLTKVYNSPIIISEDTYYHVQNQISCRILDCVKVKGKDKPIIIYEAIDEFDYVDDETSKIISLTETAFKQYRERKFSESIHTFDTILNIRPNDFLSKMFIPRCQEYQRHQPPEDWDGYYIYKTK